MKPCLFKFRMSRFYRTKKLPEYDRKFPETVSWFCNFGHFGENHKKLGKKTGKKIEDAILNLATRWRPVSANYGRAHNCASDVSSRLFPASRSRTERRERSSRRTSGHHGPASPLACPVTAGPTVCEGAGFSVCSPAQCWIFSPREVILFGTFFLHLRFILICVGMSLKSS